ncbi:MAG: HD domain-containing protein [Roseburia sp.]|nr:HD domain-containing protein [Roseburia sp.]
MKLVTVEDLRDGNVIASDVLLEDYTVVLSKGTVIKEPYIEKLRELDIYTVYIEEEAEEAPAPKSAPKAAPKAPAKPAPKAEAKTPAAPKSAPKKETKKPASPKLSMEEITILKEDVREQVKDKIKDILELHVYQKTEGLKKLSETAQNIVEDILEDDAVVEKVYDVKERSADIYEHSLQVCTIATLIALKLGLSEKEVYDISVSALIHDLGLRYLVVRYEDQDINLLPTKEQEEYKKHSIYGYTAIKNEDWLSDTAKEIVLNHHEHKDGSGFPLGTDMVSRMTQIVGVCDEFDELICGVGKARVRVHEAINLIRNYSGIWFDDDIVSAFLQLIAVYPVGSKVKTNKNETAIVMHQNAHFPERPVLRIVEDRFGQVIQGEKIVDLIKDTTVVIQSVIK